MKAYLAITRSAFLIGMAYRFGFIFSILGNVIYMGVAYYLWRSIYRQAETLRGLTFHETFLYVALGSAVFILLKNYAEWYISYDIREGTIITTLVKPVDYQLYNLFANLGFMLLNLLVLTVPTLVMLVFVFRVPIQSGPGLLLFPLSLLLAFLVSFLIDYMVGVMGFYSESVWGMSITKEIFVTVLSGALIPLQFFPEGLQRVLYWLPFQAMYHTPLMMVTKPGLGYTTFVPMLLVQLAWVLALFLFARLLYNQAVKVLRISGG